MSPLADEPEWFPSGEVALWTPQAALCVQLIVCANLTLLAGVSPGDLPTFAVAVVTAVLLALFGSALTAIRAARVDPVAVIRS